MWGRLVGHVQLLRERCPEDNDYSWPTPFFNMKYFKKQNDIFCEDDDDSQRNKTYRSKFKIKVFFFF